MRGVISRAAAGQALSRGDGYGAHAFGERWARGGRRLRAVATGSLVILLAALCLRGGAAFAATIEFTLGAGDKVSISVYKRPELSGEFRVLPAGTLSLPFVESIPVSGRTLPEVKAAIVDKLRNEAGILDPRVAIDLLEVRPIVVSGEVRRPGTYPYQQGMTVIHAVATAGGPKTLDIEAFSAFLEVGRLREKLRQTEETVALTRLRRLRLLAEKSGAADFTSTADIKRALGEARLAQAVEAEQRALTLRTNTFQSQVKVLGRQTAVFQEEIRALTDQASAKERERVLVQKEADYVEGLMKQGLSPRTSRVIELQRIAVQIEGERRQIAASIAKAKQEIGRIDQTLINTTGQRDLEIATMLKDADDAISNLGIALDETRISLGEARDTIPGGGLSSGDTGMQYTILRTRGRENERIVASADSPLLPGDLVDVPRR